MSKKYREVFGVDVEPVTIKEMREFVSRPGRMDDDGKPIYFTEQHHQKECDVNLILKKYDKTGVITHISKFEGEFGDLRQIDYKEAQDLLLKSEGTFMSLPSEIRKRFKNSPGELLKFFENPDNRQEAIELGLIRKEWTDDTDGLGEHVKQGENKDKQRPESPPAE